MLKSIQKNFPTPDHPMYFNCFACGADNDRGLQMRFFIDEQGVKAIFTADKSLSGYFHVVHGGIISTLLDEAIIWATYTATGRIGVTAELTVRFLKPVPIEERYIIKGKMLKERSRLWIAEAILIDEKGTVYAKAVGKVIPVMKEAMDKLKRKMAIERINNQEV